MSRLCCKIRLTTHSVYELQNQTTKTLSLCLHTQNRRCFRSQFLLGIHLNHVHLACSYSETSLGLDRGPHIYVTPQHDLLPIQIRVDKLCSVGVLQTSKERFDLLHDGPSKCNTRTICCTSQPILWCMAVAPLAQGHRGTVSRPLPQPIHRFSGHFFARGEWGGSQLQCIELVDAVFLYFIAFILRALLNDP